MTTDQERAAFEAAMIAKAYPSHNFQRDGAGMYYSPIIYAAFVAWQTATARQASEIEALRQLLAEAVPVEQATLRVRVKSVPPGHLDEIDVLRPLPIGEHLLYAHPAPQPQQVGLSPQQEPKYTVNGHAIVNRASGEEIPADEPVFIFRARDKYAASIIGDYANTFCTDPEHRAAVEERFIQFGEWAEKHPERMKEPDTAATPPQPTAPAPQAQAVSQWQGIESAPKNGTEILVWWAHPTKDQPGVSLSHWLDNSKTATPWAGWALPKVIVPGMYVSHWMHKPGCPESAAQKEPT